MTQQERPQAGPQRPTATTITDPELDALWDRAHAAETQLADARARLAAAVDLLHAGTSPLHQRAGIVRRLCTGEVTPEQARHLDRGEG
ncbi:hypothetical protein [Kitasatospora sp. NPDC015120]|uniref:hypothetical protein n=1 Tax=Kitasatospora sp. NPDC015120 TaxID=3364023 RepID=UPI0036F4766E